MSETSSYSVYFAFVVTLLYALALVVLVLTARYTYHKLGKPLLIYKETHGDNCKSGILHCLLQFAQLFTLEQQLAVASCRMVVVRPVEIFCNVHILDPHLVIDKGAICIDKTGARLAYRLYLGTREHYAGCVGIADKIIECGTLVFYIDI